MIQYAGVDLGWHTPDLCAWVRDNIDPTDLWLWSARTFPGSRLTNIPFRQPHVPRKVEIGNLFWPTTASQFAHAHYVVDQSQLDAIRLAVYGASGTEYNVETLVLDDGVNAVDTDLWLLPARPLQGLTDQPLYLITLVDERFFWWFRASALSVTGGTTTWTSLFSQLATALGITLTVDTIPAAYLMPDPAFTATDEPLPLLLDAACYCVGQRFVRQLDGTCRTWSATNSRDQVAANLATLPTAGNVDGSAGGVFALGTDGPLGR
jgi:hypothetical protein